MISAMDLYFRYFSFSDSLLKSSCHSPTFFLFSIFTYLSLKSLKTDFFSVNFFIISPDICFHIVEAMEDYGNSNVTVVGDRKEETYLKNTIQQSTTQSQIKSETKSDVKTETKSGIKSDNKAETKSLLNNTPGSSTQSKRNEQDYSSNNSSNKRSRFD